MDRIVGQGVPPIKQGFSAIRSGVSSNGIPEFRSEMKQPENPAQSASQTWMEPKVGETHQP